MDNTRVLDLARYFLLKEVENHYSVGITCRGLDCKRSTIFSRETAIPAVLAIHTSVDGSGEFLRIVYNNPRKVTVHRINGERSIRNVVGQPGKAGLWHLRPPDSYHTLHTTAILVTCGNGSKPEDPSTLKISGLNKGSFWGLRS
jgi:hypothetical protein